MLNKHIYHTPKQLSFLYEPEKLLWFYEQSEQAQKELIEAKKINPYTFLRQQKNRRWIGGRGSGKTNLIGKLCFQLATMLPQCCFYFASLSYKQIENNCLPEIKTSLAQFGLYDGIHYTYGKRPPKNFKKPFSEIEDFERVLIFWTGFYFEMLSNERNKTLDRGKSFDGGVVDELAFIEQDWYESTLSPTVRPNQFRKYMKCPLYGLRAEFTSAPPTLTGQWVFKFEKESNENPSNYLYIESTPRDNPTLPKDYIDNLEKSLSPSRMNIEVWNKKLIKPENSFYPAYDEKMHFISTSGYKENSKGIFTKGDTAYDENTPLYISFDFNASLMSMIVAQHIGNTIYIIDSLYVKYDTIDKLIQLFNDKYANHINRYVDVYGDRTGYKVDDGGDINYYELIETLLKKQWTPTIKAIDGNIEHKYKFLVINNALSETSKNIPNIRIANTCTDLNISIINSSMKSDYQKDKAIETKMKDGYLLVPAEHATHLSDAFDYLIYPLFSEWLYESNQAYDDIGFH